MTRSKMMSIPAVVLTIAAVALLVPRPAEAQLVVVSPTNSIQTVSDTAAATLLGPYFEVDLSNPTGMNTIFTVGNTGAVTFISFNNGPFNPDQNGPTAVLAHVVIWSDLGVPVFNFNIYLTGYDVDRIDMRKVLNGSLPQTASAGQDPTDTISPKGFFSQDINFASCNTPMNYAPPIDSYAPLPPAPLTAAQIANLQTSLTGNASAGKGGLCAGASHNDNIARGYITIDTVDQCSTRMVDLTYIQNDITFQSFQLTGEVYYVDQLHGITRGDSMVHIHASQTDPLTTTNGNYTFYGRYDGFNAADHRQPLATTFNARYLNGNFTGAPVPTPTSPAWGSPPSSPPTGSSSLIVWRDSKVAQQYFTCGSLPSPYPLTEEGVTFFDEQEHAQFTGASVLVSGFPIATQVVKVGSVALPASFQSGWIYLDLSHSNAPGPSSDTAAAQAWVQVIEQNGTQLSNTMHRAQAADSATRATHITVH